MFFRKIITTTLIASFLFVPTVFCLSHSTIGSYQTFNIKEDNLPESQNFSERIPNKEKEKSTFLTIQAIEEISSKISDIKEMVLFINNFRKENGLPPLEENKLLDIAAEKKAEDMFEKGYFSHLSPEGITPWYWIRESGYEYKYAGENLAKGFSNNEKTFEALVASPSHKENILNENYQDVGIAVISKEFKDEGERIIVVQMFGSQKERNDSPKQEISYLDQDEIKLSIIVNSNDQSINTIMASLKYQKDKLEFIRTDRTNSEFSIFLEDDNKKEGILNIISLQPFPGIKGKANVINLIFKPLKNGVAEIKFLENSKVLANDGYGTNVLRENKGIIFEI